MTQGVCVVAGGMCGCQGVHGEAGRAWQRGGACVVKGGGMGYDEIRRYDQ